MSGASPTSAPRWRPPCPTPRSTRCVTTSRGGGDSTTRWPRCWPTPTYSPRRAVRHPTCRPSGALRDEATREHGRAAAAARLADQQERRVRARATELGTALAAWSPVRAEHQRARALSEFAEGRGSDNTRQVRLSAYVLAARLGQVVAAANERLGRMSDDRFLLEHTARARGRRTSWRPEPAGPRPVDRRGARPGDALGRGDLRGLPRPSPGPGRRGHRRGGGAPGSTPCSSTRGSARSTPTPSSW